MKLLVLTAEPISADILREAAGDEADDAEVMVVSPALTGSPLRFWVSDADDAIAHAGETAEETVERLDERASTPRATRAKATRCRRSRTRSRATTLTAS